MKKIRSIGMIIGLIILISAAAQAQYYYTSYGYAQDWYMPQYVHQTIYNNYNGYEIAHVQRYNRHGYTNFNVLLHRNGWFVEVRVDGHGHIYKTIRHRYNNPLMVHNCSHHCGYHKTYYTSYYPKYHTVHHHNTVYVNSNHGHANHHTNYYTNVYVEKQPQKTVTYQNNNQAQNSKSNQKIERAKAEKVVRIPQQNNNQNVDNHRTQQSGNRVQAAQPQQVTRQGNSQNTSRSSAAPLTRTVSSRGNR